MTVYRTSSRLLGFKPVMAATSQLFGAESLIFRASVQAALGLDRGGAKFLRLVERLSVDDQNALWRRVKKARCGRIAS